MKKIILLVCFILPFKIYAQCEVNGNVPEEFVRNRYTPSSIIYGHPYTMFNKRYSNFNIKNEIDTICKNIQFDNKI